MPHAPRPRCGRRATPSITRGIARICLPAQPSSQTLTEITELQVSHFVNAMVWWVFLISRRRRGWVDCLVGSQLTVFGCRDRLLLASSCFCCVSCVRRDVRRREFFCCASDRQTSAPALQQQCATARCRCRANRAGGRGEEDERQRGSDHPQCAAGRAHLKAQRQGSDGPDLQTGSHLYCHVLHSPNYYCTSV